MEELHACKIETKDIRVPVSDGGLDNLDFGLAEYAEGEAERTFSAYLGSYIHNNQSKLA